MKSIKILAIFAALTFLTTSCVEKSGKYKAVVAQRDSLEIEKLALYSNFNQTIALLNDIEAGFKVITENEKQMQFSIKGAEGKNLNQRELISAQMRAIKESMDQNRAKIAELRALEAKKKQANGQLTQANSKLSETIDFLQSKMDEQNIQLQSLQKELVRRNIVVEKLDSTLKVQQEKLTQQETKLSKQTIEKNTVWYCIATSKQLKEKKIVTDKGLFHSAKVMRKDFDQNAFTKIDLRTNTSIPTNSTSIKFLSSHPQSSYILVKDSNKKITISITDPISFWSVSNYLVVKI